MTTPSERPSGWATAEANLVAGYPCHVPMGLPLPVRETDDDRDDKDYTL